MTRSTVLALLIGLGLAVTLFVSNDIGRIVTLLLGAGWGILLVVALHTPQTLFSALGWRALLNDRPSIGLVYRLRWVRESVNALLPVAQIGGDVVRARLLARRGVPPPDAGASCIVDISMEMAGQIVFTLIGAALLVAGPHIGDSIPLAVAALIGTALAATLFIVAQRLGLFRLIEPLIARGGKWRVFGDLSGLHDAVIVLYRQPRRLWTSAGFHLLAWLLGGVETWGAMRVLGVHAGLREAMIVEALGQAVRGLGFLIPGALGVQEGGYLLVCAMFGIAAPQALALSLVRRVRDLALGLPGLALWHRIERRRPAVNTLAGTTI